jgi:hypothetical protein
MKKLAAAALLLAVVAACGSPSSASHASDAQPAVAAVYPPGIKAFKNPGAAVNAGLYTSSSMRDCCFIKKRAVLTLEKPAGAQVATLYFFVPDLPPYKTGQSITVSVGGRSATASSLAGKQIVISIALPPRYVSDTDVPTEIVAAKSINPQKLGINNDTRDLSVLLKKVEYL